jgi:DNA polymerase-3 subunit delta'
LPINIITQILGQQGIASETAAVAAALAGGSASRAIKIASEEVMAERSDIIPAICAISRREIGRLFKVSEEYAADRGKAAEILELTVSFMRDALLLHHGGSNIVNRDMEPLARQEAGRFSAEALLQRIEWVSETLRAIKRNANARLALDVLFMRLASH